MSAHAKGRVRRLMIRGRPLTGYAMIGREFLQDKDVPGEARMIGAYVLSQVESWEVRIMQLAEHFDIGRNKVYGLLKALMLAGYGARRQIKSEDGMFDGVEYVICDDRDEVEKIKAEWREGGTPALDEPKEACVVAEIEDGSPRPCFRYAVKRDPVNGDAIEKNNIYKSSPLSPHAEPIEDLSDSFRKLKDEFQKSGKAGFFGDEAAAWKTWQRLSFEDRHKALACWPLYHQAFRAMFAKWDAGGRAGRKPRLASGKEYLRTRLFDSVGTPVDASKGEPESENKVLCRKIAARGSPDLYGDGYWPHWIPEFSRGWWAWNQFFIDNGYDTAPCRVAIFPDFHMHGAKQHERGWRFPTLEPPISYPQAAADQQAPMESYVQS